jgi:predicted DNA-binding transcriptional regulator AlpA
MPETTVQLFPDTLKDPRALERWLRGVLRDALDRGIERALAPDRLLPRRTVEEITGLSRNQILRLRRRGDFPDPLEASEGAARWKLSEILEWMETRPRRRVGHRPEPPPG